MPFKNGSFARTFAGKRVGGDAASGEIPRFFLSLCKLTSASDCQHEFSLLLLTPAASGIELVLDACCCLCGLLLLNVGRYVGRRASQGDQILGNAIFLQRAYSLDVSGVWRWSCPRRRRVGRPGAISVSLLRNCFFVTTHCRFSLIFEGQVVENVYGIASEDYSWVSPEFVAEWRAEAGALGWDSQEIDAFDHKFMFLNDCGVEEVNDVWFKAVQVSSCQGPHRSSFADAASGLHRTRRFGIVATSGFF
jgi:hypothetical protein